MKALMLNLRSVGAKDTTINFVITLFAVFIFVLGTGLVVILLLEVLKNEPLSPSIIAILTAIAIAAGGLITVSHTTNQINGTASQSAQMASDATSKNAMDTSAIIEQVIKATLAAQSQADKHTLEMKYNENNEKNVVENNTLATKQNSEVIERNTEAK